MGVAFGDNSSGQCNIPLLDYGVSYTQVAAGACHTVLLLSNGTALSVGSNVQGQGDIPALKPGETYLQVAAGGCQTALLRSDGKPVGTPGADIDIVYETYTQVATGA